MTPRDISVAIPTYQREGILLSTIESLLEQGPAELLVIDQTPAHEAGVEASLRDLDSRGRIRWLRLPRPSITRAMNTGLQMAGRPAVLFLDDDVVPAAGLLEAHASGYSDSQVWGVAGQVLQPGQEPDNVRHEDASGFRASLAFPFNSTQPAWVQSSIACNFSVRRDRALQIGGFDENFRGVAYRFETEFCRRVWREGGKVRFEPLASVRHLKCPSGGTRAGGGHLRSASPRHGVGDYYFALAQGPSLGAFAYVLRRPFREVCTRFHLRHPWWIPVKGLGEIGALVWAIALAFQGPRHAERPASLRPPL